MSSQNGVCSVKVYLNEPLGSLGKLHGINYPHGKSILPARVSATEPDIASIYSRRDLKTLITATLTPGDEKRITEEIYRSVNSSHAPRTVIAGIELCAPPDMIASGDPDDYLALYSSYEQIAGTLKRAFPFLRIGGYSVGDLYHLLDEPEPKETPEAYFLEHFLKYFSSDKHKTALDFLSCRICYDTVAECRFFTEYIAGKLADYGFRDTRILISKWGTRGWSDYDFVSFLSAMNAIGVSEGYLRSDEFYNHVMAMYKFMYRRRGLNVYSENESDSNHLAVLATHADYRTALLIANRGEDAFVNVKFDSRLIGPYSMRANTYDRKLYSGDYASDAYVPVKKDSVVMIEIYKTHSKK